MAEAAQTYKVEMQRLSFKGTVDTLRQFSAAIAQARSRKKKNQLISRLLELIASENFTSVSLRIPTRRLAKNRHFTNYRSDFSVSVIA